MAGRGAGRETGREEKEAAREKLRDAGVKNVLCMFSDLRGFSRVSRFLQRNSRRATHLKG